MTTGTGARVRDLRDDDLDDVIRIDALHTGVQKSRSWRRAFDHFLETDGAPSRVGLVTERNGRVIGYLLGEIRAVEFGSEPCGWIFAVGVDPDHLRGNVASGLMAESCRRFRNAGVTTVRTMVRRNDVPVLSFFRAHGFVGGSFVQLELELEETT